MNSKQKQEQKVYSSVFNSYKNNVLKTKDIVKINKKEFTDLVSFYSSILIILTDLFWMVVDLVKPFLTLMGRTAIISLTAIALLYFVFSLLDRKEAVKEMTKRIVTNLYCLGIVVFTLVMNIDKNITNEAIGIAGPNVAGVGLHTYFLFILIFTTFYSYTETLIVIGACVAAYFIPFACPGASSYDWISHLVVRIYLALSYAIFVYMQKYIRNRNKTIDSLNDKLLYMSYTDSQTGTFNKRALYEFIEFFENKLDGKETGVFILDIDDFKSYNDNYTHIKGDEILNAVARSVMEVLREEKSYLFRYGGEEFIFFIKKPTPEKVRNIGYKVLEAVRLSKLRRTDTDKRIVTVTIGASIEKIEKASDGVEKDYIYNADNFLFKGKASGKNCMIFNGEIIK